MTGEGDGAGEGPQGYCLAAFFLCCARLAVVIIAAPLDVVNADTENLGQAESMQLCMVLLRGVSYASAGGRVARERVPVIAASGLCRWGKLLTGQTPIICELM